MPTAIVANRDAILAVTRWPAVLAGVAHQVGTLEPGKCADVISVRSNPLEDPQTMANVHIVIKAGHRYDTLDVFHTPPPLTLDLGLRFEPMCGI